MDRGNAPPLLTIVADDYGYAPSYDRGIMRAVAAGAVDGVSVLAARDPDPAPLSAAAEAYGVELGLHLEHSTELSFGEQRAAFERLFDRSPAYLDGHHHCHTEPGGAALRAIDVAAELGIPVRSVNQRHRRLLRCKGVATPDLLVGRLSEDEPALPGEIERWLAGDAPAAGSIEWMVHPGEAGAGSSYDAGRAEDLALLVELGDREAWRRRGVLRSRPSTAAESSSIEASRSAASTSRSEIAS